MPISIYQKLKSFFIPIVLERTSSDMNPVLQVVLENNQLLLHAQKVNYSFGTLHKAFAEALDQIPLPTHLAPTCLILGLGAGSIAQILEKKLQKPNVIGVEADAKVIELAQRWFQLNPDIQIYIDFAENFVASDTRKYDLILVDLFVEEQNADCYLIADFWKNIQTLLLPYGKVIANKLSGTLDLDQKNRQFEELWNDIFPHYQSFYVNENILYVGQLTNPIL